MLELYCPSKNILVKYCKYILNISTRIFHSNSNIPVIITPSATHKDILTSIQNRFSSPLPEIWPCDINGEPICTTEATDVFGTDGAWIRVIDGDPIFNFPNLKDGERILVAVKESERIRPEPQMEVILYLGEDMNYSAFKVRFSHHFRFPHSNLYQHCQTLPRADRRNYIRRLRREEAFQRRNILRLTLPHTAVIARLAQPRHSVARSGRIIEENWKVSQIKPLTRDCLGALVILSDATCGQPFVVEDALIDASRKRRASGVAEGVGIQESDVSTVLGDFYGKVGAGGSGGDG
jgi:hypothetical protein